MCQTVSFQRAWVILEEKAVPVRVVNWTGATVDALELLVQFADKSQQTFSARDVWSRDRTLVVAYPEEEFLEQHKESRQNRINKSVEDSGIPWKDFMDEPTTLSQKARGDGGVGKSQRVPMPASQNHAAGSRFVPGSVSARVEIEALEAKHEAATKTLEAKHEAATKTLEAKHEAATKTLEAGHEDATKTLEAGHEAAMSNLEAKYEEVKSKLKKMQERMRKEHASERLRIAHNAVEPGARVRHQTESFCSLPGRAGVPPKKERRDKDSGESSSKLSRP